MVAAFVVVVVVTSATATSASTTTFRNGDACGVKSSDFMSYDFRGEYLVAGASGCSLDQDENEDHCYCAPNLSDGERLGEWVWRCGDGAVTFGPSSPEKVCPSVVPVAKGLGLLEGVVVTADDRRARSLGDDAPAKVASVGAESQQQRMGVACDPAIHPSGQPGDEVCPYSDCDDEENGGGNHSAICACVDLAAYGMGTGTEWICMHATCDCGGDGVVDENEREEISSSAEEEEESPAAVSAAADVAASAAIALLVAPLVAAAAAAI